MSEIINILHIEDDPDDALQIQRLLEAEGIQCSITCVADQPALESALKLRRFDLVISDYRLPGFDGLAALQTVRHRFPELPFIFLSGTIGEERAVQALREGATDYLLKDRLSRLVPSVMAAVRQAKTVMARQRVEEQLRQRDQLFRQITEHVDDVIVVLGTDGKRVITSESFKRVFGPDERLAATDSFQTIHPEDRERMKEIFFTTVVTGVGQRAEYRVCRADGSIRFMESQGSVIRDESGKVVNVVVISRDVTERIKRQEQIAEQAELLDKARDAICVYDLNQTVIYWNKGAERLYGWTAAEALGRNFNFVFDESSAALEPLARLLSAGEWQGELTHATRAGHRIIVESHWTLMLDAKGKPKSILVINTDITGRKQMEAQSLRNQRVESIGALAGGIAHDLNNALMPVLIATDLLKSELTTPESKRLLQLISATSQHASDMVKQILSFSRGTETERAPIDVETTILEIVNLIKKTFPRSIEISADLAPNLPKVVGNPTQLHQVLLNLCVNARDAMPNGGILKITATAAPSASQDAESIPMIKISVADHGQGIPAELLQKIFEPYFTTKEAGRGTGLGLSTVSAIIKAHGGHVAVASEPGVGTVFDVFLPGSSRPETRHVSRTTDRIPSGNRQHILVVDDELAVLEMTKLLLEAFNYEVTTAENGVEALALYARHRDSIQLVITDSMMHKMDGYELIRELQALNPAVKLIMVSGLSPEPGAQKTQVDAFLTKPFKSTQLLETIQRLLDPTKS